MTHPAQDLAARMGRVFLDRLFQSMAVSAADLVAVTQAQMPTRAAAAARFGAFPDTPDPLTALDLAQSGFVVEPPSGGRQRVHLLLSHFDVSGSTLKPQHVVLLNLLRVPMALARGFRVERVLGGASQSGPEGAGNTTPGNAALAAERAATVSSWLIFEAGLNDAATRVVSFGSTLPLIDRTGYPDGLEEPRNRNVIVTWSYALPARGPAPVLRPDPAPEPPVPPGACPAGKSPHWELSQMGEIGLDVTIPIPVAPAIGLGQGAALRLYKLSMLDDAGKVIASRNFGAVGGGSVVDVDALAFSKEAGQIADIVVTLRKVWKAASLGAAMTVVSASTRLVNPAAFLGLNTCLDFDDWNPTLMLTQATTGGGFGMTVGQEFCVLPLLTRTNAGVNYDTAFQFSPNIAMKRFAWILFGLD